MVLKQLVLLANGSRNRALKTLGLTPGLAGQLNLDASLSVAPSARAIEIYAGVLYESLDWKSLTPSAKKRSESQLLIISALFGSIRPLDLIPAYRLSMDVRLPKIGALSPYWRKHLPKALDNLDTDVIVDMRSQTYLRAWTPEPTRTATIRILVQKSGKRSIVSHMAKKTRGEVARELLSLTKSPTNLDEVAHALSKTFEVELVQPASPNRNQSIDIILNS
jgi:cytoplasmic iron level regulating protein YaaA (DUF328/UPF0246 family)